MDRNGGNVVQLTDVPFPAMHRSPAFSPDGSQITFWSTREGTVQIYVMGSKGEDVHRLTPIVGQRSNMDASWSPDGSRIVFISNRDGVWKVYTMNPKGGDVRDLQAIASNWQSRPVYSPDGNKIVFKSIRDDDYNGDIFIMNADGTELENLTPGPLAGNYPVWSPDGRTIAFDGSLNPGNGEPWRVYLMDLETRDLTPLTDFRAEPHAWFWFPAERGIGAEQLPPCLCDPSDPK